VPNFKIAQRISQMADVVAKHAVLEIVSFLPFRLQKWCGLDDCVFPGVFCLLFAYAGIVYVQSRLTKAEFRHFFFLAIVSSAGVVFLTVIGLTYAGEWVVSTRFDTVKYSIETFSIDTGVETNI